jgi:hypothetical protein
MHLHIFGRSRAARHASWAWGEAPRLPLYKDRKAFSAGFRPLEPRECAAVARRLKSLLNERYQTLSAGASRPRR